MVFSGKSIKTEVRNIRGDKFPMDGGNSPVRFPFERTRLVRKLNDRN